MSQVSAANYLSGPTNGVWVQADSWNLINTDQTIEGELYFLIVVHNQSNVVNISALYQSICLRFKSLGQKYTPEKEELFSKTLAELVKEIVEEEKEAGIEILAYYQFEDNVVISGNGGSSVTLVRGGEIGRIFDSSRGVSSVTGVLHSGDTIVLASSIVFSHLAFARLKEMIILPGKETDVEAVASQLAVFFDQKADVSGVGVTILALLSQGESLPSQKKVVKKNRIRGLVTGLGRSIEAKKKAVFVRHTSSSNIQKASYFIVLGLIIVLIVSVTFGWKRNKRIEADAQFASQIEPIEARYKVALESQELKPLESRSLLQEAQAQLDGLKLLYPNESRYSDDIGVLNTSIQELYEKVAAEFLIKLDQYMDLTLIEEGFWGSHLGLSDDRLIVADTQNGKVVSIGVENKDPSEVVQNDAIRGMIAVAGSLNESFGISSQGVFAFDFEEQTLSTVIEQDPDWQQVAAFSSFAGNMYVLDTNLSEIWRYRGVAGNQYARQRWLAPGVFPDFSEAIDMVVDGDIWILDKTGSVRQYSRGVGQAIDLVGIDETFSARALGVSEDFLYLLDSQNNRIIVTERSGSYVKQLTWNDVGLISDMSVVGDTILLLSGSVIYKLTI